MPTSESEVIIVPVCSEAPVALKVPTQWGGEVQSPDARRVASHVTVCILGMIPVSILGFVFAV